MASISSNIKEQSMQVALLKKKFKDFKLKLPSVTEDVKAVVKTFLKSSEGSIIFINSFNSNLLARSKLLEFHMYDMHDLGSIRIGKFVKNIRKANLNFLVDEVLQTQKI